MRSNEEELQQCIREENCAGLFKILDQSYREETGEFEKLLDTTIEKLLSTKYLHSLDKYLRKIDYKPVVPSPPIKKPSMSGMIKHIENNVTFSVKDGENLFSDTYEISETETLEIKLDDRLLIAKYYDNRRIMLYEKPCDSFTTSYECNKQQIFSGCRFLIGENTILHVDSHSSETLRFRLIVNKDKSEEFHLYKHQEIIIGKSQQGILANLDNVSRKHLRLFSTGEAWFIENISQTQKMFKYFFVENSNPTKIVVEITKRFEIRSGKYIISASL